MIKITLPMVARLKTAARDCYRTGTLRRMGHLLSAIGELAELMREDGEKRGAVDPKDYATVLDAILQHGDSVAQRLLRGTDDTDKTETKDEISA